MWATRYALVKIEWDLKVQWQTVIWSKADYEHPDEEPPVYDFIDNAVASVELLDSGSLSLTVHAAFGHPTFTDKVAQLPVYFKVQCYDGDTPLRDELRSFLITGDGERQRLG